MRTTSVADLSSQHWTVAPQVSLLFLVELWLFRIERSNRQTRFLRVELDNHTYEGSIARVALDAFVSRLDFHNQMSVRPSRQIRQRHNIVKRLRTRRTGLEQ